MAGFGLADHVDKSQVSVAVITLVEFFAPSLGREATVVNEAGSMPSKEFLEVLDSVPSAQMRTNEHAGSCVGKASRRCRSSALRNHASFSSRGTKVTST